MFPPGKTRGYRRFSFAVKELNLHLSHIVILIKVLVFGYGIACSLENARFRRARHSGSHSGREEGFPVSPFAFPSGPWKGLAAASRGITLSEGLPPAVSGDSGQLP